MHSDLYGLASPILITALHCDFAVIEAWGFLQPLLCLTIPRTITAVIAV